MLSKEKNKIIEENPKESKWLLALKLVHEKIYFHIVIMTACVASLVAILLYIQLAIALEDSPRWMAYGGEIMFAIVAIYWLFQLAIKLPVSLKKTK